MTYEQTQTHLLNNQLARHVVMKPQYFSICRNSDHPHWSLVGDWLGQPAETRWLVRANRCGEGMGPFQWTHWYHRCPASNSCAALNQSEARDERWPVTEYPGDPRDQAGAEVGAEPDTPAHCCEDLGPGERCQQVR